MTHEDYASWNTISSVKISADGEWVVYELNPQDGDGFLVIRHIDSGREELVPRGQRAVISPGDNYVAFHIKPGKSVERQAKVEKKKRDEMPLDSLGIFIFNAWKLEKFPALDAFIVAGKSSDWMAYVIDEARLVADAETDPGPEPEPEPEPEPQPEPKPERDKKEKAGKVLYVFNPVDGQKVSVKGITDYLISDTGNLVAGFTEKKGKDTLSLWEVFVVKTSDLQSMTPDSRHGEMKQLAMDKDGSQIAWMFSADTTDNKVYDLYHFNVQRNRLEQLIHSETAGLMAGYGLSEHRKPYFSDNGQRLFLATRPVYEELPKDTLLAEEKYSLDLWHWQDPMLQSQQKVMLSQLQKISYPAVYHLRQSKLIQLADEEMTNLSMDDKNNGLVGMGQSSLPYMVERQWTGGNSRDLYVVDVTTGSRKLVAEKVESSASLSPAGNYIIWYDHTNLHWMLYSIAKKTTMVISEGIPSPIYDEKNDVPAPARPYGIAGWTPDDKQVLVYDNYDVWMLDPSGKIAATNLTGGYGRNNNMRLRVVNLDPDDMFVRPDEVLILSGFDEKTKQSGYFSLAKGEIKTLIFGEASYSGLRKARHANRFVFTKSTFTQFPDLWAGGMDFTQAERISDANPQQAAYYWGSARLVSWNDFNNQPLEGLLYLPEDFDESRKYPMLIYFYERSSNGLYQHFIPSPSRSTINRSYCTSNGYIVFVPDITYETGFPGESAYNAIVSGTKAMVERYPFIDRENMGLQGQSWGGYQIAYLITRTNMFKAAMAGAPVSNMVSAYGGIRWQTGINRQFQYEQTQSRIGGTLWEKPLRYIENSPVFFADKIETPLLMMHNDDDGAVPWYQGIELFTAMRRLSKPVWMLVYNGEAHNLTKWPNRMDLSVRMYQFFDYFLKGEPAPVWLEKGIPVTEKGKYDRYELVE